MEQIHIQTKTKPLSLLGISFKPLAWLSMIAVATSLFYLLCSSQKLYLFYFIEALLTLFISACWFGLSLLDVQEQRRAGQQVRWYTLKHRAGIGIMAIGTIVLFVCAFKVKHASTWELDLFHSLFAVYEVAFVTLLLAVGIASALACSQKYAAGKQA